MNFPSISIRRTFMYFVYSLLGLIFILVTVFLVDLYFESQDSSPSQDSNRPEVSVDSAQEVIPPEPSIPEEPKEPHKNSRSAESKSNSTDSTSNPKGEYLNGFNALDGLKGLENLDKDLENIKRSTDSVANTIKFMDDLSRALPWSNHSASTPIEKVQDAQSQGTTTSESTESKSPADKDATVETN